MNIEDNIDVLCGCGLFMPPCVAFNLLTSTPHLMVYVLNSNICVLRHFSRRTILDHGPRPAVSDSFFHEEIKKSSESSHDVLEVGN
jgi:hypothetical protein